MSAIDAEPRPLEDRRVPVRLRLSALWVATSLLFAYGDIVVVWRADIIEDIMAGELAGIEVTQAFLVATAIYVAIPILMVFLTLVLRPEVCRWANIIVGVIYAVTIVTSAVGEDWAYYYVLSAIETALVLLLVRYAWTWPRTGREGPVSSSAGAPAEP